MGFWRLDPEIDFLNHGSFGAAPEAVLLEQQRWRDLLEREPVRFFLDTLEPALDAAREKLATFLGARSAELVFVHNATTAVNTVLRYLEPKLARGDQLLTTDHAYPACVNAMRAVAARAGAEVIVAKVPFPIADPAEVTRCLAEAVTPRTRWALVDHVTSPTALIFPVADILKMLQSRGVQVMIDGAHAPGMLPLELHALSADWYTGNLHKWCCAPKGAGFLWARDDRRDGLGPLVVSHGATMELKGRSRYHAEFDYGGTDDMTPYLSVPAALSAVASLEPGGWPEVMAKNHALAIAAGEVLVRELSVAPGAPDSMRGSMVAVELPSMSRERAHALHETLIRKERFEVPLFPWLDGSRQLLRVSAQRYNRLEQYERLAKVVRASFS